MVSVLGLRTLFCKVNVAIKFNKFNPIFLDIRNEVDKILTLTLTTNFKINFYTSIIIKKVYL